MRECIRQWPEDCVRALLEIIPRPTPGVGKLSGKCVHLGSREIGGHFKTLGMKDNQLGVVCFSASSGIFERQV